MENQRLDFGEIVRKIAEDKMLLPVFREDLSGRMKNRERS